MTTGNASLQPAMRSTCEKIACEAVAATGLLQKNRSRTSGVCGAAIDRAEVICVFPESRIYSSGVTLWCCTTLRSLALRVLHSRSTTRSRAWLVLLRPSCDAAGAALA